MPLGLIASTTSVSEAANLRDCLRESGKASDGFGPVSPIIARGINYNNVLLTTRLNGEIVQQENSVLISGY